MSLIGPRPLLPETVEAMGAAGIRRGLVPPGLTGWAQVNGNARLEEADKLALDLWYIDHASPRLNLLIILKTLGVVILGDRINRRSEEHTSELQSLMRISYAVFCLKKKQRQNPD